MSNDSLVERYRKNVDLVRNVAVDQLNLGKVRCKSDQVVQPLNDLLDTSHLEKVVESLREILLTLNESKYRLKELLGESRELTSDDYNNLGLRIQFKTGQREVDGLFERVNEQVSIYLTHYLEELNPASNASLSHKGYNFEQLSGGEKSLLKKKDRERFGVFLKGFFEFLSQQHGLDLSENVKLIEEMEKDHEKLERFFHQTIGLNLDLHKVASGRRSSLSYLALLLLIVLSGIIVLLKFMRYDKLVS